MELLSAWSEHRARSERDVKDGSHQNTKSEPRNWNSNLVCAIWNSRQLSQLLSDSVRLQEGAQAIEDI